jgi:hypothetical protein
MTFPAKQTLKGKERAEIKADFAVRKILFAFCSAINLSM